MRDTGKIIVREQNGAHIISLCATCGHTEMHHYDEEGEDPAPCSIPVLDGDTYCDCGCEPFVLGESHIEKYYLLGWYCIYEGSEYGNGISLDRPPDEVHRQMIRRAGEAWMRGNTTWGQS